MPYKINRVKSLLKAYKRKQKKTIGPMKCRLVETPVNRAPDNRGSIVLQLSLSTQYQTQSAYVVLNFS